MPVPSVRHSRAGARLRGWVHAHPQHLGQNPIAREAARILLHWCVANCRGHEAAVLCGAAPGDTQGELDSAARVFAVPFETPELPFCICGMSDVMPYPSTRYCDLTPTMAVSFERAFGAAIDRAIAVFKPDAIICHHLYLLCALVRERVRGIPVCGVCHSTDIRQMLTHGLAHDRIVAAVRCLDAVFSLHAEPA